MIGTLSMIGTLRMAVSVASRSSRVALLLVLTGLASAGTWTKVTAAPPSYVSGPILLTDGTVIVQGVHSGGLGTGLWYRLTPDINGSYTNGTWSQIASPPNSYAPDFYASAVLPDGRVVVAGGEYNGNSGIQAESNMVVIYNPAANTWTLVTPPSGWSSIGDAQSVVLPSGTFMLGNCCSFSQALLNASNLTWTVLPGSGKADANSEEGWTLLPNGKVLTVDINSAPKSELFNPSNNSWASAGNTPSSLVALCETGPAVLRPDGTVVAFGSTGNTGIYNSSTGTWTAGPTLPSGRVAQDTPGAQLPSGSVLVAVSSPGTGTCSSPSYTQHTWFYELNGTTYTLVGGPTGNYPYENRLLVLPNGNVLWTHNSNDVEVYTPNSSTFQSSWQPTITSVSATLLSGIGNNVISGTQFNGLTQSSMYGDDYQAATNYPIVRIKNNSTGHLFYCKTHNHSTMAVATGSAIVSTQFDIPVTIETGPSTIVVIANGIPSNPVSVTLQVGVLNCTASTQCYVSPPSPGQVVAGQVTVTCNEATLLTASATICGDTGGCVTNTVAPPVPQTSIGAGDASRGGSGGSCSLSWSWGGNNYSQQLFAP